MAGEMQRYIISFQATLQGHKMVLSSLRQMEGQVKGVTTTTKTAGQATKTYSAQMKKLAIRAAMVIPVWLLLRSAFMGVLRTFGDMIRASLDLEEGLARIQTVMHGTGTVVQAEMIGIKRQILDMAVTSRMSIKELAEAYYFLKTANLSAAEASAAFKPTVDAAVGTMNSAKDTARAVAGMYNTMGENLGENLTVHEKFQKIADILTYTYTRQDVQLNELIQGYTKLAPYLTGLDDSFLEMVTTIGHLNTRMLRGGRTGRLLGRAILQMTKNAKNLAATFGVTFDPDKPLTFLKTIKAINQTLKIETGLTAAQGEALREVFETRGAVPVRLLISTLDDLIAEIELAGVNADGFAAKIKEIRMGTVVAQSARMKNILAVLNNEFISGVYGAGEFADALKTINDSMEAWRPLIRDIGISIGWLSDKFSQYVLKAETLQEITREMQQQRGGWWIPILDDIRARRELAKRASEKGLEPESLAEYMIRQDKKEKAAEEEKKVREKLLQAEKEITEIKEEERKLITKSLKEEQEGIKHNISLLKIMGANALDIAQYRLDSLKTISHLLTQEDYELQVLQRQNEVIQEQQRYRKEMVSVIQRAELDMMKAAGATELQLLEIKEKHLETQRDSIGNTQYELELGNLRLQQSLALQKEKAKEVTIARNLALAYEKADMFQKVRVRRAIELTQLETEELTGRFRKDAYDRQVILDYWGSFGKESQNAIAEAIFQMRRLPGEIPQLETEELLPEAEIIRYWQTWTEKGLSAADIVNAHFKAGLPTLGGLPTNERVPAVREEIPRAYYRRTERGIVGAGSKEDLNKLLERIENDGEKTREELRELRRNNVEGLEGVQQKNEETRQQIRRSIGD